MAQIYYYNADGSIKSSVKILKDGRALEVYPYTPDTPMRTWPSMEAWTQEMPREWRTVEAWTASIAATASKAKTSATATASKGAPLHIRAPLAYFLGLPEGATTSREAIRDALVSYRAFYNWGTSVYRTKRDVQPANPVYRVDDFLVTLTGLDPRGEYTLRQILNAVLARQTRKVVVPTAPVVEEAPPAAAEATFQSRVVMHLSHVTTQLAEKLRATAEIGTLCMTPGPLSDSTRERILHLALFGV